MYIGDWQESSKQRDHSEEQHVGELIILKWILEKLD
jgi:hypothetical protein